MNPLRQSIPVRFGQQVRIGDEEFRFKAGYLHASLPAWRAYRYRLCAAHGIECVNGTYLLSAVEAALKSNVPFARPDLKPIAKPQLQSV